MAKTRPPLYVKRESRFRTILSGVREPAKSLARAANNFAPLSFGAPAGTRRFRATFRASSGGTLAVWRGDFAGGGTLAGDLVEEAAGLAGTGLAPFHAAQGQRHRQA